ncbi:MAG: DUF7226 domain-containing protein [Planctomycetota bacterium]|jgi:hypothetical protein
MRIATQDIAQADDLQAVLKVVEAVGGGARTDQDIGQAIEMVTRQGRYYRRAAEILALIKRKEANNSVLTPAGRDYLRARPHRKRLILLNRILSGKLFQRVIPFLESKMPEGCTKGQLTSFIAAVTAPTGPTMIPRRTATVISWLTEVGLLKVAASKYVLGTLPSEISHVAYTSDNEPLVPSHFILSEYQEVSHRTPTRGLTSAYLLNTVRAERANAAHLMLTNLVASKIRSAGAIPKCNRLIDLAARIKGKAYIFEIKSTNRRNAHDQIRRGISQLYEYRYQQRALDANLVLVIQKPLARALRWVADYLTRDREILLAWDDDRRSLHCPDRLKGKLAFMLS